MHANIKVALIGAGSMVARRHLPSLSHIEDVSVVGLCDCDETRLRETATLNGITRDRLYTDYRVMLEQTGPDAVYVIMPPHHAFDLALEVMDRGHALFIEKPPGISTSQAREMAAMAQRSGAVSAVAFQRRFHPLVHACRDAVAARAPLHRLRIHYHKWSPPENGPPYYDGIIDILRCDAVHAVDAARFYAGLVEVKRVQSLVRKVGSDFPNCFQALLTFANGVVASIDADWSSGRRLFAFEFHAPGACAVVDIDGKGAVWLDNAQTPVLDATCHTAAGSDDPVVHGGFLGENRAFIDAVRAGRAPHNRLQDALRTMELIDAIYAAAPSES